MNHREGWIDIGDGLSMRAEDLTLDSEGRLSSEPYGYYFFAWKPRRCRNGKIRWLCWLEDHMDGTFSRGNRAH